MVFNEVMEKYERIIADATEARDAKIIPIDIPTAVLTARDLPGWHAVDEPLGQNDERASDMGYP